MESGTLSFNDKLALLMKLGTELQLSDMDDERVLDGFDMTMVRAMGAPWNEKWDNAFPQNTQIITLLRALVLLDNICETHRGSVPTTAFVFEKIVELELNTPELIDQVLRNKSKRHPYTPFGERKYRHLTSFKEYQDFLASEKVRKIKAFKLGEQNRQEKKRLRAKKAMQHMKRTSQFYNRTSQISYEVEKYFETKQHQFIEDWLTGNLPFPQGLIPSEQLIRYQPEVLALNPIQIDNLFDKIPKKSSSHLKDFKKQLNDRRIILQKSFKRAQIIKKIIIGLVIILIIAGAYVLSIAR